MRPGENPKAKETMPNAKELMQQSIQFLEEVWIELKKVYWPSWMETRAATVVVIVIVLFFALFLGLIDFGLSQMVQRLLAPRLS